METSLFRGRAFANLLLLCSFIVVGFSGLVLLGAPRGRIPGWEFLWLGKGEWAELHEHFGILMIVLTAVHLWLNWKPLKSYFRAKMAEKPVENFLGKIRLEFLAAILVCVVLAAASLHEEPEHAGADPKGPQAQQQGSP